MRKTNIVKAKLQETHSVNFVIQQIFWTLGQLDLTMHNVISTAWKVSKYDVFSGPYFPVFGLYTEIYRKSQYSVRIQENADQKKLSVWTLFTQCRHTVEYVQQMC